MEVVVGNYSHRVWYWGGLHGESVVRPARLLGPTKGAVVPKRDFGQETVLRISEGKG
jgi:hypothetical protein